MNKSINVAICHTYDDLWYIGRAKALGTVNNKTIIQAIPHSLVIGTSDMIDISIKDCIIMQDCVKGGIV